jgi:hypothetical protein
MRSIFRMPQSRAPPPSAIVYGSAPAAFSVFDMYGVQSRSSLGRRARESTGSSSSNATTLDGNESEDDWDVLYTRSRRQVGLYNSLHSIISLTFRLLFLQRIYEETCPPRQTHCLQYNGYLNRDYYCIHDYRTSVWGKLLTDGLYRVPGTKASRDFRCRFRVPAPTFHELVEMCDVHNIFECSTRDAAARIGVPVEKVLACLCVLSRGAVFDDIEELSGMSKSTAHRSFKAFICNFSRQFYDEYVYSPEGDALVRTMDVYSRLGFDGAFGSTDCVHVKMDQCSSELYWRHRGKEGYPTLVYSVAVDHSRRIMSSTASFQGTRNDRTIMIYDSHIKGVHNSTIPKTKVSFELMRKDGTSIKKGNRDVFLICDNGYHKWKSMIAPFGLTSVREERLWSEGLESVRKDVECTFGVMKARFRSLRYGVRLHSPHEIDSLWFCCCILHNMLLMSDGFSSVLNSEAAWEALDPEDDAGRARLQMTRADLIPPLFPAALPEPEVLGAPRFPALEVYNSMLVQSVAHVPDTPLRLLVQNTQTSTVDLPNGDGQRYEIHEVFEQESEPAFFKLRKELVEHYAVRWGHYAMSRSLSVKTRSLSTTRIGGMTATVTLSHSHRQPP